MADPPTLWQLLQALARGQDPRTVQPPPPAPPSRPSWFDAPEPLPTIQPPSTGQLFEAWSKGQDPRTIGAPPPAAGVAPYPETPLEGWPKLREEGIKAAVGIPAGYLMGPDFDQPAGPTYQNFGALLQAAMPLAGVGKELIKRGPRFLAEASAAYRAPSVAGKLAAPFYSRLDEAVAALPERIFAPQIAGLVQKGQAATEELTIRKVPQFLARFKADQPITKAELLAHLEAHPPPQVSVKSLGVPPPELLAARRAAEDKVRETREAAYGTLDDWLDVSPTDRANAEWWALNAARGSGRDHRLLAETFTPEHVDRLLAFGRARDELIMAQERLSGAHTPARYNDPNWMVPGGTNYREQLFHVPSPDVAHLEDLRMRRHQLENTLGRQGTPTLEDMAEYEDLTHQIRAAEADAAPYTGGHYGSTQSNVIAHTRSDTRDVPGLGVGEFIQEDQADVHQLGKAHGYDTPAGRQLQAERTQQQRALQAELNVLEAQRDNLPGRRASYTEHPDLAVERDRLRAAIREKRAELRKADKGVGVLAPDLPFQDERWSELTFKHHLAEAAANPNTTWLGWTTGETQAERYNLRKHFSRVEFEPDDIQHYMGPGRLHAYNLEGERTATHRLSHADDLDELVGRGPADAIRAKIDAQEAVLDRWSIAPDTERADRWAVFDDHGREVSGGWHSRERAEVSLGDMQRDTYTSRGGRQGSTIELSGPALETGGGEGMTGFYDERWRKRIEKIIKPFGGVVEQTTMPVPLTDHKISPQRLGEAFFDAAPEWEKINGKFPLGPNRTLYSREELGQAFREGRLHAGNMPAPLRTKLERDGINEPIWVVKLSPAMKEAIQQYGLPILTGVGAAGIPLSQVGQPKASPGREPR